ncbi:DUF5990 family protein [Lacibacter sediminis]|uniref:Uncharacterized protein n=1 Tax=Lacibacter sediminis TaxID=2760713 RepID=A0A7G5XE07_9BACT|nr:DUF5990 family protein [Lacibacter sediminis]QNA43710.1 hypothetical protein H4075_16725 [Lacibacter sediminis]
METEINLQIVLTQPPPNVLFGLQKGSGNIYETVQKQKSASQDLLFTFSIKIKGDKGEDVSPKFSGPFVQGPAGGKFVYIDIGTYAGQTDTHWSRRLKVPLTGITWELIDQLIADPALMLQAKVPGTGKDGGPNCATVKPFEGWQIKR